MWITKPPWVNHEDMSILTVDLQPNGNRFVTGGGDHTVRIWIVDGIWDEKPFSNQSQESKQDGKNDENEAENGDGDEGKTQVVNEESQKVQPHENLVATLSQHYGPVNCVRWSPSGHYFASASDDQTVMLWELSPTGFGSGTYGVTVGENKERWRCVYVWRGHGADVIDINWSFDGKHVASGSIDNNVIIWTTSNQAPVAVLKGHSSYVQGVTWDPLGKYIASQSEDQSIIIWRTTDWHIEETITTPFEKSASGRAQFRRLSWSPDGQSIVAPYAKRKGFHLAPVIKRGSWTVQCNLVGHREPVITARYNPRIFQRQSDGTANVICAVGSLDCCISLWVAGEDRPKVVIRDIFDTSVLDLTWSADGYTLFASSTDGTITAIKFDSNEFGNAISMDQKQEYMQQMYGDNIEVTTGGYLKSASIEIFESSTNLFLAQTSNASTKLVTSQVMPKVPRMDLSKQKQTVTIKNGKKRITPIMLTSGDVNTSQPTITIPQVVSIQSTTNTTTTTTKGDDASSSETTNGNKLTGEKRPLLDQTATTAGDNSGTKPTSTEADTLSGNVAKKLKIAATKDDSTVDLNNLNKSPRSTVACPGDKNLTSLSRGAFSMNQNLPIPKVIESGFLSDGGSKSRKTSTADEAAKKKKGDRKKDSKGNNRGSLKKGASDDEKPSNRSRGGVNGNEIEDEIFAKSNEKMSLFKKLPNRVQDYQRYIYRPKSQFEKSYSVDLLPSGEMTTLRYYDHRMKKIWEEQIRSTVTLYTGCKTFFAYTTIAGAVHICTPSGRRILPVFVQNDVCVLTGTQHGQLLLVRNDGELWIWNIDQKVLVKRDNISSLKKNLLRSYSTDAKKITEGVFADNFIFNEDGTILVTFSDLDIFLYNPQMDTWSKIVSTEHMGSAYNNIINSGEKGNWFETWKTSQEFSDVFNSFNSSSNNVFSIHHLENELSLAYLGRKSEHYNSLFKSYIALLTEGGFTHKIREACDELLKEVPKLRRKGHENQSIFNDEDEIINLISECLPIVNTNKSLQRLVNEIKTATDINFKSQV